MYIASTKIEIRERKCPICSGELLAGFFPPHPVECRCGFDWDGISNYWTRVYEYLLAVVREKLHDKIGDEEAKRKEEDQALSDYMNAARWPEDY